MTPDRTTRAPEGLTGYSPPLLVPRSRLRWVLFTFLNILSVAAASLVWQYLRDGEIQFRLPRNWPDLSLSMGQGLLQPQSLYPWMIPLAGMLLAVQVGVTITTAVMYQLLLAIFLSILVAVLGQNPVLALALATGCIVSARMRLRREYPFLAGLMGMVPVSLYLGFMVFAGLETRLLVPLQTWILTIPFLLGIILSVLVIGSAVLMARVTKFQPGVLWPMLIVLLAGSSGILFGQIGLAEVEYAYLVRPLESEESLFPAEPRQQWRDTRGAGLGEQAIRNQIREDLQRRKQLLEERCDRYLRQFGDSSRAPSVAWIRAQGASLQLEASTSDRMIFFTASYVREVSAPLWRALLERYDQSDPAALARWWLGILEVRAIRSVSDDQAVLDAMEQAEKSLRDARDQLRLIVARHRSKNSSSVTLFPRAPEYPRQREYERVLFEAELLVWTIHRNDVLENPACARSLAELRACDPHASGYSRRLRTLAANKAYRDSPMGDNLRMALARNKSDIWERAVAMMEMAKDERTDVAIEANYELGRIAMQQTIAPALGLVPGMKSAEEYFRIVIAAPDSPWRPRAAEHLARLRFAPARENTP